MRSIAKGHALLVLDEFGVLDSTNAVDLYERVREPGMSVCASAQSYESLGPQRKQVVTASSIKILHRCGDPEEIIRYAGEREVPAFSQLLEEEEAACPPVAYEQTPKRRTTVHMQKQYAMSVEDVQQLTQGKIALISGGLGAWCQVYPLVIPEELLREALASLSTPTVPAPASPPVSEPQHAASMSGREDVSAPAATASTTTTRRRQAPDNQGKGRKMQDAQASRSSSPPAPLQQQTRPPVAERPPTASVVPLQVAPESCQVDDLGSAPGSAVPDDDDDSPVDF